MGDERLRLIIGGLGLAVVTLIVSNTPEIQRFLKEWQTLLAGFIAIGAALIGGYYVQAQSVLSDRHEQDRIRRQFEAERALLPLTLSKMSAYSRASAGALRDIYPQEERVNIDPNAAVPAFPDPPTDEIRHLANFIRSSQDANIREVVAELLSRLQVQSARMLDLRDMHVWKEARSITKSEIDEYILNAADIYARCAGLFEYARRQSQLAPIEPAYADQQSALNQIGVRDVGYPRVHERLRRAFGVSQQN